MASRNQQKIDENSPFYLHPGENPSLVLVTPLLDRTNYHTWARNLKMALLSKNKLEFIDGTITRMEPGDPNYGLWRRNNNMVLSWILRSLSPSIAQTAVAFDSAQDLWENLRERFSQSDVYRIADLQTEIFTISQGERSVTDYFASLQTLWDEFCSLNPIAACTCEGCFCNVAEKTRKKQEVNLVICFLKGLNPSFSNVKSQIMAMDPLPLMNKVFSLVLQYEREFLMDRSESLQDVIAFAKRSNTDMNNKIPNF